MPGSERLLFYGRALPAAIGAKLARPDCKVMAIAGDGDFLMNVQEMETARRLDSDIVIFVWVDNSYGQIEWKQEIQFGHDTDLSFGNPDWSALARSFDWTAHIVNAGEGDGPALQAAVDENGPSLVAMPIDYREAADAAAGEIEMHI